MGQKIILSSNIKQDAYTDIAAKMFDITIQEKSITEIEDNLILPEKWNLGAIYGPSGSGKSTLLSKFGKIKQFSWDDRPIISNLDKVSPEEASRTLCAVGLSTVPAWLRPYKCLSVGEQFRAFIARVICESSKDEVLLIDEFTSVVDRNVAKAASCAFSKFIKRENRKAIVASCHEDILEWLEPDWGYNPIEGITMVNSGRWQRPDINLEIFRAKNAAWKLFAQHHYLSNEMNSTCRVFLALWNNRPVGIICILRFPHGHIKNGWRISRVVVLPDFQGIGIGVALTDYIASLIRAGVDEKGNKGRTYIRTTHPAMVSHMIKSGLWKEVTGSRRPGNESSTGKTTMKDNKNWVVDSKVRYSLEYIGPESSIEESKLFWEKI